MKTKPGWDIIGEMYSSKRTPFGEYVTDKRTGEPLKYFFTQNNLGHRECSCPDFYIRQKKNPDPFARECKHLRDFKRKEGELVAVSPAAVGYWPTAVKWVDDMVSVSMSVVPALGKSKMAAVLAENLGEFKPMQTSALTGTGKRKITFEDSDI